MTICPLYFHNLSPLCLLSMVRKHLGLFGLYTNGINFVFFFINLSSPVKIANVYVAKMVVRAK